MKLARTMNRWEGFIWKSRRPKATEPSCVCTYSAGEASTGYRAKTSAGRLDARIGTVSLLVLVVVGDEVEEPVLDDGAAERAAVLLLLLVAARGPASRRLGKSEIRLCGWLK